MRFYSIITCVLCMLASAAFGSSLIMSRRADKDVAANTDPDSAFWSGIPAIFPEKDNFGKKTEGFRTDIRSLLTKGGSCRRLGSLDNLGQFRVFGGGVERD